MDDCANIQLIWFSRKSSECYISCLNLSINIWTSSSFFVVTQNSDTIKMRKIWHIIIYNFEQKAAQHFSERIFNVCAVSILHFEGFCWRLCVSVCLLFSFSSIKFIHSPSLVLTHSILLASARHLTDCNISSGMCTMYVHIISDLTVYEYS